MSTWSLGASSRSSFDTLSGDSTYCDSQSREPPETGAFLCLRGIGVRTKGWIHQRLPLLVAGYVRRVKPTGTLESRKPTIAPNLRALYMDMQFRLGDGGDELCHVTHDSSLHLNFVAYPVSSPKRGTAL